MTNCKQLYEYIQYLDRIYDRYAPDIVVGYGGPVSEQAINAQNHCMRASVERNRLIQMMEDKVYNEIEDLLKEKKLDDVKEKKTNVKRTKKVGK